jgi:uncharacterized protein (DUF983 family)
MSEQKIQSKCIFPPCPTCGMGYLVPFSFNTDVYEKWKCTQCGFEVTKR